MEEGKRNTRKKDKAPRGVFQPRKGLWAVRFTCAAGHVHEETIGPIKGDAVNAYHDRRQRTLAEPGWCPRVEREQTRAQAARDAGAKLTVREYADRWLKEHVAIACKPRTREHYASVFKHHVYPALGDLALSDVSRERLRSLLADRAANGRESKGRGRRSTPSPGRCHERRWPTSSSRCGRCSTPRGRWEDWQQPCRAAGPVLSRPERA